MLLEGRVAVVTGGGRGIGRFRPARDRGERMRHCREIIKALMEV